MEFWSMAWEYKWCTLEQLKIMVITEENPWGEITPYEFEKITGIKYEE